jgi:MFS family permease
MNSVTRWLEFLVLGVYVFQQTGSPFYVGLVSMLRLLPMALSGPFTGAVAERIGRRRLYLTATLAVATVTATQAVLALTGLIEIWHLAVGAFLSGVYWSTDLPVRRTMLAEIAGAGNIAAAVGFDSAMNNTMRMLGPLFGGALLQTYGLPGVFLLGLVSHGVALALVYPLRAEETVPAARGWMGASVLEGIDLARNSPAIIATLLITVLFNTFAFPVISMIPVIGETRLALSPALIGLLMSTEGAGALVGSLLIALLGREAYFRSVFWGGVLLSLLAILVFAVAGWVVVAAISLFCFGLGMAAFAAMQTTLILLSVPSNARSRLMGILSFCIGFAPIGFLHIGWLVQVVGPSRGLVIMAVEGIVALVLVLWRWPQIR